MLAVTAAAMVPDAPTVEFVPIDHLFDHLCRLFEYPCHLFDNPCHF